MGGSILQQRVAAGQILPSNPTGLNVTGAVTFDTTFTTGETSQTVAGLSPTGVAAGTYDDPQITVGSDGRIISVTPGGGGGSISGLTPGTYGDATHVPQFTVNAEGLVTSVINVPITGGGEGGGPTVPGIDGIDGEDGWPIPGQQGVPGPTGPTGPTGGLGQPGLDGSDGDDGWPIPGSQGLQGPTGGTGATGAQGPPGVIPTWDTDEGDQLLSIPPILRLVPHIYEGFGVLPLSSSFSTTNIVASSVTDGPLSLLVSLSGVGGGNNIEAYFKSAPSTPYDVYMKFTAFLAAANSQTGLLVRNSGNGRIITFGHATTQFIAGQNWTNATTFSSAIWTSASWGFVPKWFRITNDGTNLKFIVSDDGFTWYQYQTVTLATFITTGDQIGFYMCPGTSGAQGANWIQSFGTSAPTYS